MKAILTFFLLGWFTSVCFSQSTQKFKVNFDFNAVELNTDAKDQLNNLIPFFIRLNSSFEKIKISGYCDFIGSDLCNKGISIKRAANVKQYLISKGVGDSLIKKVTGYGKTHPLNDNGDSVKRLQNRRVEILVSFSDSPDHPHSAVTLVPKKETIDINKVAVNSTVIFENINFYDESHHVLPKSYPYLEELLNTMMENKNLKIEIQGHVCCILPFEVDGIDRETQTPDLSVQRAKEVYSYLVQHGIEKERLSYRGFGGKYPLVKELTEDDRTKNRRVGIKILSK